MRKFTARRSECGYIRTHTHTLKMVTQKFGCMNGVTVVTAFIMLYRKTRKGFNRLGMTHLNEPPRVIFKNFRLYLICIFHHSNKRIHNRNEQGEKQHEGKDVESPQIEWRLAELGATLLLWMPSARREVHLSEERIPSTIETADVLSRLRSVLKQRLACEMKISSVTRDRGLTDELLNWTKTGKVFVSLTETCNYKAMKEHGNRLFMPLQSTRAIV